MITPRALIINSRDRMLLFFCFVFFRIEISNEIKQKKNEVFTFDNCPDLLDDAVDKQHPDHLVQPLVKVVRCHIQLFSVRP